ncbi:MAG: ParB/RepB/Spo0J family partition protein [Psychromonas sp.]|nr:ParB/RepB/Spo0J family partition protein [Psychromonas sp.]
MVIKKRGLGRGLDSLLNSSAANRDRELLEDMNAQEAKQFSEGIKGKLKYINIDYMQVGKYQPRRDMSSDALEDLANSIRSQGIIQPIIVREINNVSYEIVAGERRWRAAKMVGLDNIPCIVKKIVDEDAISIALIENIQRENLNAMEEAIALKRLIEEFHLTHESVAKVIGKSRASVSNLLRLNKLTHEVQILLEQGDIEMGHARALLSLSGTLQIEVAQIIIEKQLTVREAEKAIKQKLEQKIIKKEKKINSWLSDLSNELTNKLETNVLVQQSKSGKGKLIIEFNKNDKLLEIISFLNS